ncbi:hypothetical protein MMC20_005525 [Loxospora ochrophaea]|nr:hypothetical protein [Loxospora ochrophaea]
MAGFPYNPTRAFLSALNSTDFVYILQPSAANISNFELLAVNTSRTLPADNIPAVTVSPTLPFLNGIDKNTYIPIVDGSGSVSVYAGTCDGTLEDVSLWILKPETDVDNVSGSWTKQNVSMSGGKEAGNMEGVNYLASGIAFSSAVNGSDDLYVFGGMCPESTSLSAENWQSAANYSNAMLTLQTVPQASGTKLSSNYDLSALSSRGPPIPEAGFSITPLEPAFFNSSNGSQSQQQNFVLLGGHTQQAFINMSQVALFSLPEQSWAFLPVSTSMQTTNADLTIRDAVDVEPRSGHTAVLTPDSKRIVVFGGWVGNTSTPASPQLAVLNLGEGYGGSGDWQWSIPTQHGTALENGAGLYGHGAVMLPGGIMMVVGGYTIPSSNDAQKRAESQLNSNTYLWNTTSDSWITSYAPPALSSGSSAASGSSSGSLTTSKKAGLGAGLGFGLAAVFGVLLFFFCYNRRLKHRREAREKELHNLAIGAQRYHSLPIDYAGGDARGGEKDLGEWAAASRSANPWEGHTNPGDHNDGAGWRRHGGTEAERTGLLLEIPSPTRGLRRSLHSRGNYQQAPRYDDGRLSRGSGNIHPIDEREEYEDLIERAPSAEPEMIMRPESNVLVTAPILDPFRDPAPLGSHPLEGSRTPSPQSPARERKLEVQKWVDDWTAAEALMQHHAGRLSPDKTDRTSSTLSERSTRSTVSGHSIQQSIGAISRSLSQRSGAPFISNVLPSSNESTNTPLPLDVSAVHLPKQDQPANQGRSRSLTLSSIPPRTNTMDSFTTATTSFPQLQSESVALLGGHAEHLGDSDPSPLRTRSRARGWMGSMRRAFGVGDRGASTSLESEGHSASSSPTKYHHTDSGLPRRAASTGGMLWQRRQGARDWDVEGAGPRESRGASGPDEADDEEWDIESAVERRVVQVMFTVPKEKLRIVNGAPEADAESVVSIEREWMMDAATNEGKGKGKARADG